MERDTVICQALDAEVTLWGVTIPYNPSFNQALKAGVPSEFRNWDPVTKRWIINADWVTFVADLAIDYFRCNVIWREELD